MEKKILLTLLFAIFVVAAILPRIIQKRKKIETVGCIGIKKPLFFLGKISLFTSYALALVQVLFINLSLFGQSSLFFWIGTGFIAAGVILFVLAVSSLGTFSLRVGHARSDTDLRQNGIYSLSRNPMLLGLYFMALGSAIYVQNPINWILVIIALGVHHKIIITEETFLLNRFGEQWIQYGKKVRRYI
jgi:protein-S-isoprenylcysteine O-methyltransferase Ste14